MANQSVPPNLMTMRIIFLSMLVTPVIFGLVLFITPLEAQPGQEQLAGLMPVLALGSVFMMPVLRKVLMGDIALTSPDIPPGRMEVDPSETAAVIKTALARYQTGSIVGFAVAESVGIYGFVAAFMTGNAGYALPFLAGSMALIAVQFPRAAGVISLIPLDMRAHAEKSL